MAVEGELREVVLRASLTALTQFRLVHLVTRTVSKTAGVLRDWS